MAKAMNDDEKNVGNLHDFNTQILERCIKIGDIILEDFISEDCEKKGRIYLL